MLSLIKHTSKGSTYKPISADSLLYLLKSPDFKPLVDTYRTDYLVNRARGIATEEDFAFKGMGIPKVCFAAEWKKVNRKLVMKEFNGLVLLEVNNLRSAEDAVALRNEAAHQPYTLLTFVGLSGYSVKIICSFKAKEDFSSLTQTQLERCQLNAFKRLHYIYSAQLGLSIDNLSPDLNRTCMLSYDEHAYYNPNSETLFVQDEDIEVPEYKGNISANYSKIEFGSSGIVAMGTIFEWCLRDAIEKARIKCSNEAHLNEAVLSLLADYCYESCLPLDYAIMHTRWKYRFDEFSEDYITQLFSNAYEKQFSRFVPYAHIDRQALMAYKSEAFLRMHYELRRNVINGVVQYRKKNGFDYDFHNLTEQVMNSMTHDAIKQGIGSWDKDMRRIVNSDIVPAYDPISDYLYSLPEWDGKDRVAEFASRIPSDCPDKEMYIHTWLLSMVAHWLGKDTLHGNALVPILIGDQGCGKTSFCGIILPPQLRDYYNDKVEFKNETSLILGLSSFALINIDEFDALKRSQQPTLKYLISKSDVKLRMPYGKSFEQRRRYASFIATTNNSHPLVDRTGSRRFVCIKVTSGSRVEFLTPIDYEQLYAQLRTEVYHNHQYWLDEAQTAKLMTQNLPFMRKKELDEIMGSIFALPECDADAEVITTDKVKELISERYPEYEMSSGIVREIGKYFNSHQFTCKRDNKQAFYVVKIVLAE